MPSPSDDLLLERIWRDFHGRLRSFVGARVPDAHIADDILQDVFLKVHRSIGSLREEQRLAPWLFQITRNAIVDHHRAGADSRHEDDSALEDIAAEESAVADEQKLAEGLLMMIEDLPAHYRDAVRLAEIEGLGQAEMAERLGLSLSGGKSRVQRGREKLKALLLECCHVELDRRGGIAHYEVRESCCRRRGGARGTGCR